MFKSYKCFCAALALPAFMCAASDSSQRDLASVPIGSERAIGQHLQDGDEFTVSLPFLLNFGRSLFVANWTVQDGGGRPMTKGTGKPISDPTSPLLFPRNFNRISGPDSNSCAGCHNSPIAGGDGDIVGNVFVLGQRFDSASFDHNDLITTRGAVDEGGNFALLGTLANSRATPGLFGSGYYEMLAREITADLKTEAAALQNGQSVALMSKGISFGTLSRHSDGTWNTSLVTGLPAQCLSTTGAMAPTFVLQPFHQVGNVVSIRQFSNNAFNHHHGMQSEERFGLGVDADGDGVIDELTRADITAVSLFQAAMAVPGRVIPNNPTIREAIAHGEKLFSSIGCATCHIPSLPLYNWMYVEPNPNNPTGNLQTGQAPDYTMDLTNPALPLPRLQPVNGVINVPLYTDFKLHNITSGPADGNVEALDQNQTPGSTAFFAGNGFFLTKRLWTVGSKPNKFHHGKYGTIREAILAHAGEAIGSEQTFAMLSTYDRGSIIEFLKTLKSLRAGTPSLTVDELGNAVQWPPSGGR